MSFQRNTLLKTSALAVAILAGGLLPSCSKSGAKIALRPNFASGSTHVLSVRTTTDGVFTTPDGNNLPAPSESLFAFTLHGGDVDAKGNTTVTAEVDDAMFPMVFVPVGVIFKMYSFDMKLTPTGRVAEFVNTAQMRAAMRDPVANSSVAAATYVDIPVDTTLKLVSDDALRVMIEPITSIWPDAPVSSGDTWDGPEIFDPALHSITSYHYTVDSVNDTEAVIQLETKTRLASDRPSDPTDPMVTEVSGTGTGTIHVDSAEGSIISYELQRSTAAALTVNGTILKVNEKSRVQAEMTAR